MKRKIFICLLGLVLAGCKNQMECTLEKEEEKYKLMQEVILKINKENFVTESYVTANLIFEENQEAKEYYDIFKGLDDVGNLEIKDNKLIMKDIYEYTDNSTISEVKKQLEKSGYKCK